jgi:hypothetical protein
MANTIEFKYLNSDTLDPICGLTVNYSVRVIAVLANTKGNEEQARGAAYTSDIIINGDETTDSNGIVEVDVTNVFSDSTFLALWQKFSNTKNYNVSIQISLESDKQEIGPYLYLSRTAIPQMLSAYNVTFDGEDYSYEDLEYWSKFDPFTVDEIVIDEELLKAAQAKKLDSQRKYINSLEDFQNEIVSQSSLQIPYLNEYNPININQIITRCLELNVGTIENGLAYTTDAGLVAETNRLNKIKTLVNQISNLYPTITIEDGEGIPYQNVGVIPEPFRGLGFYQDGGDIIAFAKTVEGEFMNNFQIMRNGRPESVGFFPMSSKFNDVTVNLTQYLNFRVGDVIEIVAQIDETNYLSKLIIKN